MLSTNPYLHFNGNTEEAMNFYRSIFGGEFTIFQRYKEIPGGEKMPPEDQEKIMHVSLTLGNGVTIMATDWTATMGAGLSFGNNFHICIQAESERKLINYLPGSPGMALQKCPPIKHSGVPTLQCARISSVFNG